MIHVVEAELFPLFKKPHKHHTFVTAREASGSPLEEDECNLGDIGESPQSTKPAVKIWIFAEIYLDSSTFQKYQSSIDSNSTKELDYLFWATALVYHTAGWDKLRGYSFINVIECSVALLKACREPV